MMFQGSLVAIVTPLTDDGELDFESLRRLVDWHVAEGTDGIVVVGTTGESPTLSVAEHEALIARTVEYSAGRIPVIAGTGANSTTEAIELTRFAHSVGAVAGLSVVPYYNKPTQEGLYQHFCAIADAVDLPLILYNVPGRTVADLQNETTLKLAIHPNIIGIKDATADLYRASELIANAPPRDLPATQETMAVPPLFYCSAVMGSFPSLPTWPPPRWPPSARQRAQATS